MGKIIKFPNSKDNLKDNVEKSSQQPQKYVQGIAVTGLVALFLFSLVINLNLQNEKQQSRKIASVQSTLKNASLDHYILESLVSSGRSLEVVLAEKPTHEDQLVFGTLIGNYTVKKKEDRIVSIQIKKGQEGLQNSRLPILLSQYRRTLGLKSLKFKLLSQSLERSTNKLVYSLFVKDQKVGSLIVSISPENKILGFSTSTEFK